MKKAKIAVFTCVTGGYDEVFSPLAVEQNCDYYIVSDDCKDAGNIYQWIDIDSVVPNKNMSNKDKNRYCKLHPHLLFPEYNYTIYHDGSIQIIQPITHNISRVGKCGIALHKHRSGDCVYSEGIFLTWLGVVEKETIQKEAARYMEAGLPKHFGLRECSMIVTDLTNPICESLYEQWYEEYLRGSKRDQQALIYVLWKMGLTVSDIGNLGGEYCLDNNPEICWRVSRHYKG